MQRFRTTIGLWSRLALASTVAALAFAALLILEFAMATLLAWILMMIVLPLLAVSLAVLVIVGMVFVPAWIVLALAYRWLRPAPMIAGRISHDGMADALERVAYQLTHPDDFLRAFLRAGGVLLGLSFCLTVLLGGGIVALSVSPQLTEWRLAVVAGALTVVVTTIAVVYAELRDGASVERTIADRAGVLSDAGSDESASNDATITDLQARVDRLATQTSVPSPTVRLGRARTPIAASVGYRPATSSIVVSRGLVETLSERELEAVLAHELAHIANRDAAVLTALSLPVAKTEPMLEDTPESVDFYVGIIWLFVVVAAVPIAVVTRLSVALVSRYREHVADQAAVEITGDPAALASALETLGDDLPRRPTTDVRGYRSTAAFSIVPPPWEEYRFFDRTRRFVRRRLFGTHPPTGKRIERLRRTIDD